jgi:hypothetical protein
MHPHDYPQHPTATHMPAAADEAVPTQQVPCLARRHFRGDAMEGASQ